MNLHQCAKNGNVKLMSILLKNDDVNEINSVGYTPAHYACFYGHLEAVKLLYENEANFEIRNFSGKTPFYIAVSNNRIEIVKYLLLLCDISIPDKYGFTVLHEAIANRNFEMVKLLMSANTDEEVWVDINAKGLMIYAQFTDGELGRRYFSILDYCEKYKTEDIKEYLFGNDNIIIIERFDDMDSFLLS